MAFKMKGNPMQRNFGVGKKSPMAAHKDSPMYKKAESPMYKDSESPMYKKNDGRKYPTGMKKDPDYYKKMGEQEGKLQMTKDKTLIPATVRPKKEIMPQTQKDKLKDSIDKSPMTKKDSPMKGPGKTYAGGDQGERYEGQKEIERKQRKDHQARYARSEKDYLESGGKKWDDPDYDKYDAQAFHHKRMRELEREGYGHGDRVKGFAQGLKDAGGNIFKAMGGNKSSRSRQLAENSPNKMKKKSPMNKKHDDKKAKFAAGMMATAGAGAAEMADAVASRMAKNKGKGNKGGLRSSTDEQKASGTKGAIRMSFKDADGNIKGPLGHTKSKKKSPMKRDGKTYAGGDQGKTAYQQLEKQENKKQQDAYAQARAEFGDDFDWKRDQVAMNKRIKEIKRGM